ncbi:MAG: dUTP diphosphatase [Clostridia bacterium]|nr:dUTP diphosphatase [Clostridia bacterium]
MEVKVKVKKLNDNAVVPKYGTAFSAGADLYACGDAVEIAPQETKIIHTGIAVEIPTGYVGLIYARSGLATKRGLAPANKVGVIDSDYRGELMVALHNHSAVSQTVESGERVAQLVIAPYLTADFEIAENLDDTVRGEGGFGSTGTK